MGKFFAGSHWAGEGKMPVSKSEKVRRICAHEPGDLLIDLVHGDGEIREDDTCKKSAALWCGFVFRSIKEH